MLKFFSQTLVSVVLSTIVMLGLVHTTPKAYSDLSLLREATWQMFIEGGTCSGVMIAPKLYLTAAHCQGTNMNVEGVPATLVKVDKDKDLMLLEVDLGCPCIPVAAVDPAIDTPIMVIGFPLGVGEYLTEGRLQGFLNSPIGHLRHISAPIIFGNSGGPVIAMVDGRYVVVGIISAVHGDVLYGLIPYVVPHLSIAVSVETINKFLNE